MKTLSKSLEARKVETINKSIELTAIGCADRANVQWDNLSECERKAFNEEAKALIAKYKPSADYRPVNDGTYQAYVGIAK